MGLTISYRLRLIAPTIDIVQEKVAALRAIAQELEFMQVDEIVMLQGQECVIDVDGRDPEPHLELKVHGSEMTGIEPGGKFSFRHPSHIIGFRFIPGEGCAGADLGFRIYADQENMQEWTWFSYCKTQYASNPEYGGLENFLTCHLRMIHLLDAAQRMGIECDVTDNGDYWEKRDLKALASTVTSDNQMMALIMGAFKDIATAQDATLEAPILDFPNFEYLEGEGGRS
jgi:hypothetical protein